MNSNKLNESNYFLRNVVRKQGKQ